MKAQPIKYKLVIGITSLSLFFFTTACVELNSKSNNNDSSQAVENRAVKTIKEIILLDNGAVVPTPRVRRVVVKMKNAKNIFLSYSEGEIIDDPKNDIAINEDTCDEVRDEVERIAEIAEDGMDVKPGKQPCVGMNSLNVAVVYNTGDTSRFAVMGAARCDPSLYPSVWALDSMATEVYRTYKSKF